MLNFLQRWVQAISVTMGLGTTIRDLRPYQLITPQTRIENDIKANENIVAINLVAAEPTKKPRGLTAKIFELVPSANYFKNRVIMIEGEAMLYKLRTSGNRFIANLAVARSDNPTEEKEVHNSTKEKWLRTAIDDLVQQLEEMDLPPLTLLLHTSTTKTKLESKTLSGYFIDKIKKLKHINNKLILTNDAPFSRLPSETGTNAVQQAGTGAGTGTSNLPTTKKRSASNNEPHKNAGTKVRRR